ncbi:MAG: MFS transporter [Anaerolineae bacterium]|nr:MFS transporter [Anaerolineae bacterium]
MEKKSDNVLVGIAFLTFIGFGLNAGLMGVTWPSMRDTFGVGDDAYGVLTIASMIGSLVITFYSGTLIERFGTGILLLLSCVIGGLGFLGHAVVGTWGAIIALKLVTAAGTALLNPGINAYFATHESAGRMNWLHACFGLGATLSPAAMTRLLASGASWRLGYALVGVSYFVLAVAFGLTLRRWPGMQSGEQASGPAPGRAPNTLAKRTLALPAVWLSLAMFFAFTGMESSSGQWSYTLFTEGRGIDAAAAGAWVSVYWACMTVGRIFFGIVVGRIKASMLVRLCMAGVVLGASVIWLVPLPMVGFAGLALTGFCLAPLFPVLTSNTPQRLGSEHAAKAIGYQITAVKLGLALIPALGGVLSEQVGVEAIGPFLFILSLVMLFLHEATQRIKSDA